MKFKDIIAFFLKKEEIKYVFGHTGGGICDLIDSLNINGINIFFSRNESNATYMADGYARITGKPSIILTTTGPAATNLVTGMANAYADSIPLISICALNDSYKYGYNNHQDGTGRGRSTDQNAIFKNCCKEVLFVNDPNTILKVLKDAFRIATQKRPGPVYIGIPKNFWDFEIDEKELLNEVYKSDNLLFPDKNTEKKIIDSIYQSKFPLILLGEGAYYKNINLDFEKFINKIKIPFVVSPVAKNFVNEFNSYYLGTMRHTGSKQIYDYFSKVDLVIMLGDRLSEHEKYKGNYQFLNNKEIIQIDNDDSEIGKIAKIDMGIFSDVSFLLNSSFIDREHINSQVFLKEINYFKDQYLKINQIRQTNIGINPYFITKEIEVKADKDAVFVVDGGFTKTLFISKLKTNINQKFIVADKFSPMGYSIPASIGVALSGKKEVYCLVGDGSFQMTFNDLTCLLDNSKIKIILLLFNNQGMVSIKNFKSNLKNKRFSFSNPNFKKIALSNKMNYFYNKSFVSFQKSLRIAKKLKNSCFIELAIDQNAIIWDFKEMSKKSKLKNILRKII